MKKSEFERRAAEMKARNLASKRRPVRIPRPWLLQIATPPTAPPVKLYVRDLLSDADFQHFSPPLSAIKRLGQLDTDSDGLFDLGRTGLNISVSPDHLVRGVEIYDAVLKAAAAQGLIVKQPEGSALQIVVNGEPLLLAVAEKTETIPSSPMTPVGRLPRRATGTLSAAFSANDRKVYVSDKRGRRLESKLPWLFEKAAVLASEIRATHDRQSALRREQEIASRRRYELQGRIERLNQNVASWQGANGIREYANAVSERLAQDGPVLPESDVAKWIEWVRRYADSIDPTCRPIKMSPQEFWD